MPISDGNTWGIMPYASYTAFTPTLPQFYWDVYSAEQRIKQICSEIDKLVNYANDLGIRVNVTHDDIEELKTQFKDFVEHGFDVYYKEQIEQWIKDHTKELYQLLATQVFFGLTSDGYFCAYIPESWSDIQFDTGAVFGADTYGRLILRYNVDGRGVIDNTAY